MGNYLQNVFLRSAAINNNFLHHQHDFKTLIEIVSREQHIHPSLVEKDYWIMHCLWGLQQQNFLFELKGGTSLSKGYNIIDRFSEDIDIQIHPGINEEVSIGKNQDKLIHIKSRQKLLSEEFCKKSGLYFREQPSFQEILDRIKKYVNQL